MEQISFSDADQAKYIETAYRVGWEAAIGKSGRVSELRKLVAQ